MDSFIRHEFINSRALQYTYYASPPANATANGPALLLLHGFPDQATVWSAVVPFLLQLGLRILIPDLLGYEGTSKPWAPQFFNSKAMADDLADILSRENIATVIPIGHDWGSFLAHRYYLFHPEHVPGIAISTLPLSGPFRTPINMSQIAADREQKYGYPVGGYYTWFASPEAAQLFNGHPESFFSAAYGKDNAMNETFGQPLGMRDWLLSDKRREPQSWVSDPAILESATARFSQSGVFNSPMMWYRAYVENVHLEAEKDLPAELDRVAVPLLHIAASEDPTCPPEYYDDPEVRALFADLTAETLEATHFLPHQKPQEFADIVVRWLEAKNLTAKAA
ncbi:Alpha/beta hydrolase fold-1 [Macrophomina phaseolina MS6]|uniref:Alpha/beta hydrolase fold-1 n=2 Tax=Macrophomina phaseolina TaxID=35725 RepID=K2SZP6_MACPH|nr:Alpha/beta hydrolase fold-1 [Macrophomina phaseolina MS6]KAH7060681.1 Alpha/Beta hydrolase protein [Macrophomina phaseolina]